MIKQLAIASFLISYIFGFSQIGIGTTAPKATLDIAASSISAPISTDGLLIPRVNAFPAPVTISQNGMLVFLTTAFGANQIGLYYYDFPSISWKWIASGNNSNVWTNNNANARVEIPKLSDGITTRPSGNEMIMKDNGNVGISTTTPAYKLQVNGDIASTDGLTGRSVYNTSMSTTTVFSDNIEPWTDNGIRLYDGNTNSHLHLEAAGYGFIQSYGTSGSVKGLLENANTSALILQRDGSNVGIGNNIVPTEKLDVTGNIKFSGALMPNNLAGSSGQILVSAGAGTAPVWDSNPVRPFTTTVGLSGVYNININQYTVRVFGGVTNVNLPTPIGNLGKIFNIIGSNGSGNHTLTSSAGIIYDDFGTGGFVGSINQGERLTVQSDGTDWIVIGR